MVLVLDLRFSSKSYTRITRILTQIYYTLNIQDQILPQSPILPHKTERIRHYKQTIQLVQILPQSPILTIPLYHITIKQ
jgi:hypothetical protein